MQDVVDRIDRIIHVKRWNDPHVARVTYLEVKKKCGKDTCKCARGIKHGPYWYRVYWNKSGKKTKTKYIGTLMPAEAIEAIHQKRFAEEETTRTLTRKAYEFEQQLQSLSKDKASLQSELRMTHIEKERLKKKISSMKAEIHQRSRVIVDLRQEIDRLTAELQLARVNAARTRGPISPHFYKAEKVYKRLSIKYHPDRDQAGAEFMKDLNELWQEIKSGRK